MGEYTTNGKKISYLDRGTGFPIVLLHGYLETKEVWDDFIPRIATNYRVIVPDIPGHGTSSVIDETHSMELMAQAIGDLLQSLAIKKCVMVGHSMGGYVMLAFAELFPEMLNGLVLFHSSVFSDTDEKKTSRLQEIDLITRGDLQTIISSHIPKTFAPENEESFESIINELKIKALTHNPKGVCSLIRGMMERPDRQDMIRKFYKPILFIFGRKDNFIKEEAAERMVMLNPNIQIKWLSNSGHMGFIEEPDDSLTAILGFITKIG